MGKEIKVEDMIMDFRIPSLMIGKVKKYSKVGKIYYEIICQWRWFLIKRKFYKKFRAKK